jgi:hypothetical protein
MPGVSGAIQASNAGVTYIIYQTPVNARINELTWMKKKSRGSAFWLPPSHPQQSFATGSQERNSLSRITI